MISIIIPSGIPSKYLPEVIESIYNQQNLNIEFEVILVSQSCPIQVNAYKNFKYINITKNLGVTGGRNLGAKNVSAKCEYLLFFDHDVVADKNMISSLLKSFTNNDQVGIVTPKIFYGDRKDIIWAAGTDIDLNSGRILFRGGVDEGQFNKLEEVAVAPSIILVKKEVYEKVGGFDDIYFVGYEDTDFSYKVENLGLKIIYDPNAVCFHYIPYDTKVSDNRLLDRLYYVARNRIIFMHRFGKNIFIFYGFYILVSLYYLYLSLKYKRISPIFDYFRGFISAIKIVFFKQKN